MVRYVMHDRVYNQDTDKVEVVRCTAMPERPKVKVMYIQDAIDRYRAVACHVCMPFPDSIAYDIALERRDSSV